ncbi:MAG TPA: NUDIX domain-containing protein [Longimicrobium sp.]|nr:NUDIX domain-containing protein [Longimicrobium sp.]
MSDPSAPDLPTFRSARLVILDAAGRLLLFRYADEHRPPFWATPGGRLLPGETYRAAAARELAEETGLDAPIGPQVRERDAVYAVADGEPARWVERYFLVRTPGGELDRAGWSDEERRTIQAHRWWPLEELRTTGETILPEWLPALVAGIR